MLWDWMELLIIPIVLAFGAFYLERSERATDRKIAADRAERENKAAEGRAKLERELAADHQQEAALQAYIDQMAELLLKDKLRSTKNKEVRHIARIRTLTVLRGLDAKRKRMVLLFLKEAGLIAPNQVVDLSGADLKFAAMGLSDLSGADLSGADLLLARLDKSDSDTDREEASLSETKVIFKQLATTKSLQGATMPDGTTHE